ncbi:FhaA domain-containing protein [Streptomyces sp. NPDC018019]|uniref:FhaA domain-containing protein n=1 Tax=Streptomyces sp. NPDC018019 TaxID=3365030 RepID=UPI00378D6CE7
MGILSGLEAWMDDRAFGWLRRWRAARRDPLEVVTILRRVCDEHAVIVGRGRVVVPNTFVLHVPDASHRQLQGALAPLELELAVAVRSHAAAHAYTFAGPVTVRLFPAPVPAPERYRIHSRITPVARPPAASVSDHARGAGS